MTRSRQLAAIMFTDILGYTVLMQRTEEEAILAREKHRHIFNSITKKYYGRILQYNARSPLPALESLECALAMAEPEGYMQLFVDEGIPMNRLLKQALAQGIKPNNKDLNYLAELVEAGKIKPVIDKSYSIGEIYEAFRYYEDDLALGKSSNYHI